MKKFINIFKIPDLRKKLAFTASLLLVYRLGGKVPVAGINKGALNREIRAKDKYEIARKKILGIG